jgi:hypothetical protein
LVWTIETANSFGAICAIAIDEGSIASSKHLLIGATTRMENTGMVYNQAKTKLMDKGKAPLLVEPLTAEITLKRQVKDIKLKVRGLDANGKELPVKVASKWSGNKWILTWAPSIFYLEIYR